MRGTSEVSCAAVVGGRRKWGKEFFPGFWSFPRVVSGGRGWNKGKSQRAAQKVGEGTGGGAEKPGEAVAGRVCGAGCTRSALD